MSMTDPIADMLTRIRNAQTARKPSVTLPASKQKLAVAKVLEQEGYLAAVASETVDGKNLLTLTLKYYDDQPVIERIQRVLWWQYHVADFDGLDVTDPTRFLDGVEERVASGRLVPYRPQRLDIPAVFASLATAPANEDRMQRVSR